MDKKGTYIPCPMSRVTCYQSISFLEVSHQTAAPPPDGRFDKPCNAGTYETRQHGFDPYRRSHLQLKLLKYLPKSQRGFVGVASGCYIPLQPDGMTVSYPSQSDLKRMLNQPHLSKRGNTYQWRRRLRRQSTGIVDIKLSTQSGHWC